MPNEKQIEAATSASELKPWRYEIKYGPDGEDSYSWVYDDHGAMVATMKTHKAKQIVDAMNTRPAPVDANPLASNPVDDKIAPDTDGNAPVAVDTGLETVEHQYWHDQTQEWLPTGFPDRYRKDGFLVRELVTRSQAEELLAAEREAQQRLLDIIEEANDDKEALETQLAAAEKALEPFAEYGEDYFDKDYNGKPLPDKQGVGWVYLNYGHFRKARAVLGGKPS